MSPATIGLTGERALDDARLASLVAELRDQRRLVADDPFLLYNTEPASTERIERGIIPAPDAALADIRGAGRGRDLVGIYAAGDTFSGFANSLGQRNWFQSATFNLDWCFYLRADKASKNLYAGFAWDDDAFAAKVDLVGPPARRAGARRDRPHAGRVPHVPRAAGDGRARDADRLLRRVRAPRPRDRARPRCCG